jgi:peptidoglycan-associated lipoprotein
MKRTWFTLFVILLAGSGLLFFGCAKKAAPEKAEEMKAPAQMEAPQPAPPAQVAEQPKEEMPSPEAALENEIKYLEDEDIHFDFDKYNLTMAARELLDHKKAFLLTHPEYNIQIEGNCDERGTIEYNIALGDRRAKAAEEYFITFGIAKDRITTISYGKERPLDPGNNEEAWAKNRRDHFVFSKK